RALMILAAPVFAALALYALFQYFAYDSGTHALRAHGPLINPNSLASIFNLGLIPFFAAALAAPRKGARQAAAAMTALLFAGLVATESRGGFVAAIAAMTVLCLILRPGGKAILKPVGMMAAIFVILPLLAHGRLPHRLESMAAPMADPAIAERFSIWRASWRMFLDHPLTGTGPGTFSYYYSVYREPLKDSSAGFFAHLDPLQMGIEMGFLGPVLFYALLIAILVRTIEALGAARDNPGLRLRIAVPFAALLTVAIHAHLCFPLYLMPVLLACGILLAVWHQGTVEAMGNGLSPAPLWPVRIGAGMIVILLIGLSGSAAAGSYYFQQALKTKDTTLYLKELARADRLGPKSFIDPEAELARTNLRILEETDSIKSEALKKQMFEETETLLDAASSWNPAWGEIDYLRGRLLMIQGRKGEAFKAWKSGLIKDPEHFPIRRALAEYLQEIGQTDKAVSIVAGGLNYPHPKTYRDFAGRFLEERTKQ
ncbi:MAG TPA: O-antigen ligase family protein, partial [Alphaproteobacteria bacterium]